MIKIKNFLMIALIELTRLILFLGIVVFASGLGTILYKIYESHFNNDYMLETIPYLLECIGYLVGAYFLDKFLFNYLTQTKAALK